MSHPFRVAWRFAGFLFVAIAALISFVWAIRRRGLASSYRARTEWARRLAQRVLRVLKVHVEYIGQPPSEGLLVCNHLSYLDILVLNSATPIAFVAKREVQSWPLIGALASAAGTLFINREQKRDVHRLGSEISNVVNQQVVLGLFPEGTSSDGHKVLPFRSSLLEPCIRNKWPVCPAWIGYRLKDGSVEDEVCYWRDMTFFPHFLNLLSKESIQAIVAYGTPIVPDSDRKHFTRLLHQHVSELSAKHGRFEKVRA